MRSSHALTPAKESDEVEVVADPCEQAAAAAAVDEEENEEEQEQQEQQDVVSAGPLKRHNRWSDSTDARHRHVKAVGCW